MREGGWGRIVNMIGGAGKEPDPYMFGSGITNAALLNLTKSLSTEFGEEGINVNAVCPGWVRTDMGGPNATRRPEEAVDTIAWLATLPDGGPSGGFFRDREPIPW